MQDVNRFRSRREIDGSERARIVPHSDLANACSDGLHRFPIERLQSKLNAKKFHAGVVFRGRRELSNSIERVAKEYSLLHSLTCLYQYLYKNKRDLSATFHTTQSFVDRDCSC